MFTKRNGYCSSTIEFQAVKENDPLPFMFDVQRVYKAMRITFDLAPYDEPVITTEDEARLWKAWTDHLEWYYRNHYGRPEGMEISLAEDYQKKVLDVYKKSVVTQFLLQCDYIREFLDKNKHCLRHATFTVTLSDISNLDADGWMAHLRKAAHTRTLFRDIQETDPEMVMPEGVSEEPQASCVYVQYLNQLKNTAESLKDMGIPWSEIAQIYPQAVKVWVMTTANWLTWRDAFSNYCHHPQHWEGNVKWCMDSVYYFANEYVPFVFRMS